MKRRYLFEHIRLEHNRAREAESAVEAELVVIQRCVVAETIIAPNQADVKEEDSRDKNTDYSEPVDKAIGSTCNEIEGSIPSSPPSSTHSINTSTTVCVLLPSFKPSPEIGSRLGRLSFEPSHATSAALTGRSEGAGERAGPFHRSDARMIRRHSAAAMKGKGSDAKELEQGLGQAQGQAQEGRLNLATKRHVETDRDGKIDRSVRY